MFLNIKYYDIKSRISFMHRNPKMVGQKLYIFTSVYVRHFVHFVYDYSYSSILSECKLTENLNV